MFYRKRSVHMGRSGASQLQRSERERFEACECALPQTFVKPKPICARAVSVCVCECVCVHVPTDLPGGGAGREGVASLLLVFAPALGYARGRVDRRDVCSEREKDGYASIARA
jgi:hypothetical protein